MPHQTRFGIDDVQRLAEVVELPGRRVYACDPNLISLVLLTYALPTLVMQGQKTLSSWDIQKYS